MNILLESLNKLNESELDTSSNEYQALVALKRRLEDTGGWGLSFDPIDVDSRGRYEFAVRYWGSWEVPEDEEDDGDYDWKTLTRESGKRLDELIKEVSDSYKVKIYVSEGEKCWLYFTCVKVVTEAQEKLRYHYRGPVKHFQYLIDDDWEGWTEAVSDRQALNNLTVKAKKEHGFVVSSRITLNPDYLEFAGEEEIPYDPLADKDVCPNCGRYLNDSHECPLCDLGDESVLEESLSVKAIKNELLRLKDKDSKIEEDELDHLAQAIYRVAKREEMETGTTYKNIEELDITGLIDSSTDEIHPLGYKLFNLEEELK